MMKKTLMTLATVSALSCLTNVALAQSNVTVYGVVDAGVRTSSHTDENGGRLNSVSNGVQSESYIGLKGSEDLGNGLKAVFQVESGFDIGTGRNSAQFGREDDRTFGRTALVGLSHAKYGTLTVGRQNTLGYDFDIATDAYGVANHVAIAGYQAVLAGYRWDNSVKYVNSFNGFNVGAQVKSGNASGSTSTNSAYALAGGYKTGALNVQAVYQQSNLDDNEVFGFDEKQKLAALGATYDFGRTKVFGQYFRNKYETLEQVNDIYVAGVSYELTPRVTVKGSYAYDKQKNVNDGHRNTFSTLVSYNFSKRTDVYAEVDYNKLSGQYNNAVYDFNSALNANSNTTGVTLGLRHAF